MAAAALVSPGVAHADCPVPQAGAACGERLADAMTQRPGGSEFLVCRTLPDGSRAWAEAPVPFDPSDKWFSYGPGITLHGQGFRNPNLSSGSWTATPLNPDTVCGAEQVAVVSAGVLAAPQNSQGEPGQPVSVEMLPRLFTVTMTGDCLWSRNQTLFDW
ncbi:hypothetical protein [Candidatus Mycolicibacterium alkanivorans]|uniref:Secreted protein n=1 Tax=Candidatus Mycolicibacterium alkanivorans TaxID=2954114 RepID=A0ABS9YYB2_9MYCO|nr:hypothetical protein [Candidatus Mycolicibacterium alkanivorans]MCI4676240.1 hypothetical protein [Candidatus Mycolicibacterium alkanivorans]